MGVPHDSDKWKQAAFPYECDGASTVRPIMLQWMSSITSHPSNWCWRAHDCSQQRLDGDEILVDWKVKHVQRQREAGNRIFENTPLPSVNRTMLRLPYEIKTENMLSTGIRSPPKRIIGNSYAILSGDRSGIRTKVTHTDFDFDFGYGIINISTWPWISLETDQSNDCSLFSNFIEETFSHRIKDSKESFSIPASL